MFQFVRFLVLEWLCCMLFGDALVLAGVNLLGDGLASPICVCVFP